MSAFLRRLDFNFFVKHLRKLIFSKTVLFTLLCHNVVHGEV